MKRKSRRWSRTIALVATVALGSCGGSTTELPTDPPEIQPFVGRWDATVFRVTSDADTTIVADLIDIGGDFTLSIEASGTYTAQLSFTATDSLGIQPFVEIGQLSVTDGFVTLRPTVPPGSPASSAYTFVREDYLILDGPTEFDFNLDQEPDPAQLLAELQRQN